MRKGYVLKIVILLFLTLTFFGNSIVSKAEYSQGLSSGNDKGNKLMNGWLSIYGSRNDNGMVCFSWTWYQPADGTAAVYYEKQSSGEICRHTSQGNSTKIWMEKNRIYRVAIWYGKPSLLRGVSRSKIPENAWRYFYIGSDGRIVQSTEDEFNRRAPVRTCSTPPAAAPAPTPKARPRRPKPTVTPKPTKVPDYSWHLRFTGINNSENDNHTFSNILRVGENVYFHARLTGGAPGETILPYYEISMNGEIIESSAFSCDFGDNSDIWVRNTPFRYGTLSVRIFYYANNGNGREVELGRTNAYIEGREDSTQTEIARGWIRSCDVYFNQYGNLCFDLTNHSSAGKAIIWFSRNESDAKMTQGTITGGQIIWDSPVPGRIYEYAIWCGSYEYSQDAAALSESQIPALAWMKLYVTEDRQVVIISSDVAIHIRDNE